MGRAIEVLKAFYVEGRKTYDEVMSESSKLVKSKSFIVTG